GLGGEGAAAARGHAGGRLLAQRDDEWVAGRVELPRRRLAERARFEVLGDGIDLGVRQCAELEGKQAFVGRAVGLHVVSRAVAHGPAGLPRMEWSWFSG